MERDDNADAPAGLRELMQCLSELERLAKRGECVEALCADGANASLVLTIVQGLREYVAGDTVQAVEDLRTVADEIEGRQSLRSSEDLPS